MIDEPYAEIMSRLRRRRNFLSNHCIVSCSDELLVIVIGHYFVGG